VYHHIHEPITVAGIYEHGRFRPIKFRWQQQLFTITQICSVHDFRDGSIHKRRFSVMAKDTVYLLEFNRQQEHWFLEELWVES